MGEGLNRNFGEFQESKKSEDLSKEVNVINSIMAAGEYAGYEDNQDKAKLVEEIEEKFNKSIFNLNDQEVDWIINDLCNKGVKRKEN